MWFIRGRVVMTLGLIGVAALAGAWAGVPAASARRTVRTYSAPAPEVVEPAAPLVGDTPANLQAAFAGEMNAKTRYVAFAKHADREGYPGVARLFRACGRAEQLHADAHVHAIAWGGREARAVLDRLVVGTTADNLKSAIALEDYEVERFYPALLERARSDRETEAVRSMTFALAAEREHGRLLAAALATLDQHVSPHPIYVCSRCGKTVESLGFKRCPNCFTSAKKFASQT